MQKGIYRTPFLFNFFKVTYVNAHKHTENRRCPHQIANEGHLWPLEGLEIQVSNEEQKG